MLTSEWHINRIDLKMSAKPSPKNGTQSGDRVPEMVPGPSTENGAGKIPEG